MNSQLVEHEITERVTLLDANGKLNPEAVGFSRTPMHDTSGIGRGAGAWGRNKRWEYWAVTAPEHILALTVSALDYAAVHAIPVYERKTGRVIEHNVAAPLAGSATLPGSAGDGPARAITKKLQIAIDEVPGGTLLRGKGAGINFEVMARRPEGHQALGVVVPFSKNRFQHTLKDVARPAVGWLEIDGNRHAVPEGESWAVLDWHYDTADWLAPWRISGQSVELEFTPFWDRTSRTELLLFGSRGHQCFGHFTGSVLVKERRVRIDGLFGWAEEMRNKW